MPKSQVIFAIGDVHGEAERLRQMHDIIRERHQILYSDFTLKIVHLGDYVDRGADSAGVVDALIELEKAPDLTSISLRGNHEAMMLDGLTQMFPTAQEHWLRHGGKETLASYHRRGLEDVPESHIRWLSDCPLIHIEEEARLIFVHAGIKPDTYPEETPDVYLWTRSPRFFDAASWSNPALDGWTVIHGHTPTEDFFPDQSEGCGRRINIDTGAVFGGRLTAAIFAPGDDVRFIYA